jgi:hypothetical protein
MTHTPATSLWVAGHLLHLTQQPQNTQKRAIHLLKRVYYSFSGARWLEASLQLIILPVPIGSYTQNWDFMD